MNNNAVNFGRQVSSVCTSSFLYHIYLCEESLGPLVITLFNFL